MALFKCYDVTGKGFITMDQYKEAMNNLGVKSFNAKPSGYGLNHITAETFADEG